MPGTFKVLQETDKENFRKEEESLNLKV